MYKDVICGKNNLKREDGIVKEQSFKMDCKFRMSNVIPDNHKENIYRNIYKRKWEHKAVHYKKSTEHKRRQ